MNPFDVLEISPGASFEGGKAAYHCWAIDFQALGMQARAVRVRESAKQIAPNRKTFRTVISKVAFPTSIGGGLLDQLRAPIGRLFKKG